MEITTRRRRQGEIEGRSVDYRLEDPEGAVVAESSEVMSRKRRYLRFVPETRGAYRLSVRDEGLLGSRTGSARIRVTVDDHRLFGPRIAPYLPF